jgi:hypothetical protein
MADTQAYAHTNSKGVTYYLHNKDVVLRGGKNQTIYFFAKDDKGAKGDPTGLPDGYEVTENPRNGFLTIRKIRTPEA